MSILDTDRTLLSNRHVKVVRGNGEMSVSYQETLKVVSSALALEIDCSGVAAAYQHADALSCLRPVGPAEECSERSGASGLGGDPQDFP